MSRKNKRIEFESNAGNDMFGWLNKGYKLEGIGLDRFVAIRSNGSAAVLTTDNLTGELFPVTSWASDKDHALAEFNSTNDPFYL